MAHQLLCSMCDEVCSRFTHVMSFQSLDTEANKFFHDQLKDNPLISPLVKIPKQSIPMVYTVCDKCKKLLEETIITRRNELAKNLDEFNKLIGIKEQQNIEYYKEVAKSVFDANIFSARIFPKITYIVDEEDNIMGYFGMDENNQMRYYLKEE